MIYFDNAATTPLSQPAPVVFGNPSSPHTLGINAERELKGASRNFAQWLHCREDEIIFTSGGTESNNLAILGLANSLRRQGGTILTTPVEHPTVLGPMRFLADNPLFTVHILPIDEWQPYINSDCVLASFSHVNHETGDINDMGDIASMIKKQNPATIVHVDGVQGFCKENILLAHVDLYTFSAHKIHGPGGVGGLMARRGVKLSSLMYGGSQQYSLRPGTENIVGIMHMISTVKDMWRDREAHHAHVASIKDALASITDELPDVHINAASSQVSPYILNMSFLGVKGEVLVHALSEEGIYASMGAACRAGKAGQSPLILMGFSIERAESAVRFSFSSFNTLEEAEAVKAALIDKIPLLRKIQARK